MKSVMRLFLSLLITTTCTGCSFINAPNQAFHPIEKWSYAMSCEFDKIIIANKNYILFKEGDLWGIKQNNGNTVINPLYEEIKVFLDNDLMPVKKWEIGLYQY